MMDGQSMAMWTPGWLELVVIAGVGLLIFGRRLPDVARSVGKSIIEFKRGMREVKDDIDAQSRIESMGQPKLEQKTEATTTTSPPQTAPPTSANGPAVTARKDSDGPG